MLFLCFFFMVSVNKVSQKLSLQKHYNIIIYNYNYAVISGVETPPPQPPVWTNFPDDRLVRSFGVAILQDNYLGLSPGNNLAPITKSHTSQLRRKTGRRKFVTTVN